MKHLIIADFETRFGYNPLIFSSPGRINLIGEHTDYNDGFVLPASVNNYIYFAIKPNNKNTYRFHSFDYNEGFEIIINEIKPSNKHWANYLLGVIAQFIDDGKKIPGFDCVFGGNIPIGAGMSSSAAIECGLAFALNSIYDLNYSTMRLVKFAQKAEHDYAGVQCGVMDQFAVMHGKENQVVKLDCRSLEFQYFPFDMSEVLLVLVDTGVKHALASSEYNKRKLECKKGVEVLQKYNSDIVALRDVSYDMIQKKKEEFDELTYKRCVYVIKENERVQKACDYLILGDFIGFGRLMFLSHKGLRDDYEVSCDELDQLVEIAESVDGVFGARMMGGGFGGCTINLIKRSRLIAFEKKIIDNYQTPDGDPPEIIKVEIVDGTKSVMD